MMTSKEYVSIRVAEPATTSTLVKKLRATSRLIRADKPIGTLLLLMPTYWGVALGVTTALIRQGGDPISLMVPIIPVHLIIIFGVGALVMRSAGCIINDMWDREYDRQVARTKDRPLASGELSMGEASIVLAVCLVAGAGSVVMLAPCAVKTAFMVIPIVVVYPLMKRYTFFPQVVLGSCFNWGIFVGYAAVLNTVDLNICLPFYFGAVLWTVVYDTIYAYQDREDDVKVGVKSTAILFGDDKTPLTLMTQASLACFTAGGVIAGQTLPYFIVLALSGRYLLNLVDDVNIYDPQSCAAAFFRNFYFGCMVLVSMLAGNLVWGLFVAPHDPLADIQKVSQNTAPPIMQRVLLANNRQEFDPEAVFNVTHLTWVDRLLKPVVVQSEIQKRHLIEADIAAGGDGSSIDERKIVIPAWMRREWAFENVSSLVRGILMPLGFVTESQARQVEEFCASYSDQNSPF